MADNWERRYPGITIVPSQAHLDTLGRQCQGCMAFVRFLTDVGLCDDCDDDATVATFRAQLGI